MFLLVSILACCVIGVTVIRGEKAWELIFSTLWFNCLLVLLVLNVAFCFFGRVWGRKVTLISFGMILFHLSFVFMLLGIIYNSLFYFRGNIRLTEGETLPSGQPQSYDLIYQGNLFDFSKLKGDTMLIKMHSGYKVDGIDKRAAYEIAVGEGINKKQGIIYITHNLEHRGFTYFNDKEGYSILVILYDKNGKELYGAHIPLQSLKQKDESYFYTTGTKEGPAAFSFPLDMGKPLFDLQIIYKPSKLEDRKGNVAFKLWPLKMADAKLNDKPIAEGEVLIGEKILMGEYYLFAKEVRYWVGMNVRYEPGNPIVLASLWVGLAGIVITFIGRLIRRSGDFAVDGGLKN